MELRLAWNSLSSSGLIYTHGNPSASALPLYIMWAMMPDFNSFFLFPSFPLSIFFFLVNSKDCTSFGVRTLISLWVIRHVPPIRKSFTDVSPEKTGNGQQYHRVPVRMASVKKAKMNSGGSRSPWTLVVGSKSVQSWRIIWRFLERLLNLSWGWLTLATVVNRSERWSGAGLCWPQWDDCSHGGFSPHS